MRIIISSGGKRSGPYDWQQVKRLLYQGAIQANDFAWLQGGNKWIKVSEALHGVMPMGNRASTPVRPKSPIANPRPIVRPYRFKKTAGVQGRKLSFAELRARTYGISHAKSVRH